MIRLPAFVLAVLIAFPLVRLHAQSDTLEVALDPIEVEAGRLDLTTLDAPYAVDVVLREDDRATTAPLSLAEALAGVPGVWLNDRDHQALGERLTIRGAGWRSAFGVRGIQVFYDGIPLTMPDGQAVLDLVDPLAVARAEVIRGPASTLWGNGGGGVLYLTSPTPTASMARVGTSVGSYGLQRVDAEAGVRTGRLRVHAVGSWYERDGYRTYSRHRRLRLGLNTVADLGPGTTFRVVGAFINAPLTQNPGALTRDELETDPRAADARYVNTLAGKDSRQGQIGAALSHLTRFGLLEVTVYGIRRTLDNPLPFFYSILDRTAAGTRASVTRAFGPLTVVAGADAAGQQDDRLRRDNDSGRPAGDVELDQRETVASAAAFGTGALDFDPITLHAGLRVDRLRFEAEDRLLSNGDQSGDQAFTAVSPSAGVTVEAAPFRIFAHIGTAFESPTTTEFINRPDLAGGFNPDLEPQRTLGFEAGTRWASPRAQVQAVVFIQRVNDQLVPFQTEAGGGQTFYRNAGSTRHQGFEGSVQIQASRAVGVAGHYTYGQYQFRGGDLDGNALPGQPEHRAFAQVDVREAGLHGALQIEAVDAYAVDDENTARADGYALLHLSLGHTGIALSEDVRLLPFASIRNLTNQDYTASVIVNARGGRYYEPGPARSWMAGLRVEL